MFKKMTVQRCCSHRNNNFCPSFSQFQIVSRGCFGWLVVVVALGVACALASGITQSRMNAVTCSKIIGRSERCSTNFEISESTRISSKQGPAASSTHQSPFLSLFCAVLRGGSGASCWGVGSWRQTQRAKRLTMEMAVAF